MARCPNSKDRSRTDATADEITRPACTSATARVACLLLNGGMGVFSTGLIAGLALVLHYFYVTPNGLCAAAGSTTTVNQAWPWLLPVLATELLALGAAGTGLALLSGERAHGQSSGDKT